MPIAYVYLAIAIAAEIVATSTLVATKQFTRPLPSAVVIAGYVAALYFLTLTLRAIPVGVVYAIWSGLGIVGVSIAGLWFYGQRLDLPALIGMGLIIAGVAVIHLFSATTAH